jgi:hypothetical protein
MTPQDLRRYAALWRATHEAIHGPLSIDEAQLAHEIIEFLMNCGQAGEVMVQ